MSWVEANLSLQLLAEVGIGTVARRNVARINAEQDAAAAAIRAGMGG